MIEYARKLVQATATRPVTMVFLAAVLVIEAVAAKVLHADTACVLLALIALAVVDVSMRREIVAMHLLMHEQHDKLTSRIAQLLGTLDANDIEAPAPVREKDMVDVRDKPHAHPRVST